MCIIKMKGDFKMKRMNFKKLLVNTMMSFAVVMLNFAANSRCMFVYHQPKQPNGLAEMLKKEV